MELQLSTTKSVQNLDKFEATLARVQAALNSFSTAQFSAAIQAASNFRGLNSSATKSVQGLQTAMQGAGKASQAAGQQFTAAGNKGNQLVTQMRAAGAATQAASGNFRSMGAAVGAISFVAASASMRAFISDAVDAANKIQTFKNVITSITGSTQQAGAELDFLRAIAQKNGASFEALVGSYGNFRAASANVGFTLSETQEVFENMSGVFRVLNLDTQEQGLAFLALQQMMAKGVVSMEELRRQLGERMPTAFDTMARAVGVSQGELSKLISTGTVGSEVLLEFSRIAANDFAGGLAQAAQTGQASIQRLQNVWYEFQAAFGQAFIDGIKPYIDEFLEWFTRPDIQEGAKSMGEAIGQAFGVMLNLIPPVVAGIKEFGAIIAILAGSQLVAMAVAVGRVVAAFNPWLRAITLAIAAGGILKAAWEALGGASLMATTETQQNTVATLANRDAMIALNTANAEAIAKENERITKLREATEALNADLTAKQNQKNLIDQAIEQIGRMSEAERAAAGVTEEVTKLAERKAEALGKDIAATQTKIALNEKEIDASGKSAEALREQVAATDALLIADNALNGVIENLTVKMDENGISTGEAAAEYERAAAAVEAAEGASDGLIGVLESVSDAWDAVTDAIGDAIDAVYEFFSAGGGEVAAASGGGSGSSDVGGFLYGGLTNSSARSSYRVSKAAFAGAPAFASGTPNTSGGFPAILHPDEAVIPLPDGRTVPVSLSGGGGSADTIYLIDIQDNTRKMRVASETMVETLKEATSQLRGDFAQVNIRLDRAYDLDFDSFKQTDKLIKVMNDVLAKLAAKATTGGSTGGGSGGGGTTGGGSGGTGAGGAGDKKKPSEMTWGELMETLSDKDVQDIANGWLPDGWERDIYTGNVYDGEGNLMPIAGSYFNYGFTTVDSSSKKKPNSGISDISNFGTDNHINTTGPAFDGAIGFATGSPNAFDDIMNGGARAIIHPDEAVIPLPDGRSVPVDFGSALDEQLTSLREDIKRTRGGGSGAITINMTVNTPDADSFRRSSDQITQDLRTRLDKAARQIGVRNTRDDPTRRV